MHAEEHAVIPQKGIAIPAVKVHAPLAYAITLAPFRGLGLHDDPIPRPKLLPQQPEELRPQAAVPAGGGHPQVVNQDILSLGGLPQQGVSHQRLPLPGPHGVIDPGPVELFHGGKGLQFLRRKGLPQLMPVEVVELLQGQIPQGHRTNVRVSKRASSVGSW